MTGRDNTPKVGPRARVYELATELRLSNRDTVARVRALGIEVANHMSHLDAADVDRVRSTVERERESSTYVERSAAPYRTSVAHCICGTYINPNCIHHGVDVAHPAVPDEPCRRTIAYRIRIALGNFRNARFFK